MTNIVAKQEYKLPPPYSAKATVVTDKTDLEKQLEKREDSDNESQSSADEEVDPWSLPALVDDSPAWSELDTKGKCKRVAIGIAKTIGLLANLYFFVVSLDLLSTAFQLLGGRATGDIFSDESLLSNPVVGVMIGILTTVLVQSSSTSTSIVVAMIAAGIVPVREAIPIVMGCNVGTSVTNTIVAMTQIGDKSEFRRAFAGATVHDMFNWLTVIVLFTMEIIGREAFGVGYLEAISAELVKGISSGGEGGEIETLSVITDPLTDLIVQLNSSVLEGWATKNESYDNATLLKIDCDGHPCTINDFLFADTGLPDAAVGGILFAISLTVLCSCLILIVKILNSVLKGKIAVIIKKTINADIPYVPWITGYLAFIVGAVMTFVVQSSSVFTSALTPLVGVGIITVERVYPLTLGSNIGTTTTSLIAALAAPSSALQSTVQIALCHLFFNLTGFLIFYVVPFMRFPIPMCKFLGNTTAEYRWFALVYLIGMFLVLPGLVLALSLAGTLVFLIVFSIFVVLIVVISIINLLQNKKPKWLPKFLRSWDFLPLFMHSLEPYDRLLFACFKPCGCCDKFYEREAGVAIEMEDSKEPRDRAGEENLAFDQEKY